MYIYSIRCDVFDHWLTAMLQTTDYRRLLTTKFHAWPSGGFYVLRRSLVAELGLISPQLNPALFLFDTIIKNDAANIT
jgi:hypothetical protein